MAIPFQTKMTKPAGSAIRLCQVPCAVAGPVYRFAARGHEVHWLSATILLMSSLEFLELTDSSMLVARGA